MVAPLAETYERKARWMEHQNGIYALAVSGHTLATGSEDRQTLLWDLTTGAIKSRLVGHTKAVRCLQFVDNLVLTGSWDNSLKLWDARTSECVGTFAGASTRYTKGHSNNVLCCRFDSYKMVSGSVCLQIHFLLEETVSRTPRVWLTDGVMGGRRSRRWTKRRGCGTSARSKRSRASRTSTAAWPVSTLTDTTCSRAAATRT